MFPFVVLPSLPVVFDVDVLLLQHDGVAEEALVAELLGVGVERIQEGVGVGRLAGDAGTRTVSPHARRSSGSLLAGGKDASNCKSHSDLKYEK